MNLLRVLAIIVIGLIAWPSAASAKPGDIKTMVLPFTGAKSKTLQTEVKNALEANMDTQKYCDMYAAKFDGLKEALNLSYTNFIRTTNPDHMAAAQEFWKRCDANGDIYKASYSVNYCDGCELEKTDSELVDGKCQLTARTKHCATEI